jgi:hypothetical protein
MSAKREPIQVKIEHSGIGTDFVLLGKNVSGLSLDYKGSKGANVSEVVSMIDGVLNTRSPRGSGPLPLVVEGLARISQGPSSSRLRSPTILNARTAGFSLDLAIRKGTVSSVKIDYQDTNREVDLKGAIRMVTKICAANSPEGQDLSATTSALEKDSGPIHAEATEVPSLGPLLTLEQGRVITESVHRVLEQLGNDGRQVVLGLLEARYGLKLEDVPNHPRAFIEILGLHLGSAAHILERDIVLEMGKSLHVSGNTLRAAVQSLEQFDANILQESQSNRSNAEVPETVALEESPAAAEGPESSLSDIPPVTITWGSKRS